MLILTLINLVCCASAMPLSIKIVDLTYVFDETTQYYPTSKRFQIDNLINGTLDDWGGLWVQDEEYSSGTHVGTHIDAPSHFIKGGMTVDEIPISQLMGPAAVIDITAKAESNVDYATTIEDLQQWESFTGQNLRGAIILLRSGWGRKWNNRTDFLGTPENDKSKLHYPGIGPEACQWLVDHRQIKGIGSETLSIEIGIARNFPAHHVILGHGLFILENVANMEQIPIYGAKLHVLPMKMGKASGAPSRVFATFPEVIYHLRS